MKPSLLLLAIFPYVFSENSTVHDFPTEFPPEIYVKERGDWFALEYGKGQRLLRREYVDMTETSDPSNPKYIVVGILDIPKDGKSHMYSYVGDENGIKVLGIKDLENIAKINPIKFAQDFGWVRPPNTFTYY